MNIAQESRNAAVRIAMKHISLNPDEKMVADIAADIQQAVNLSRAQSSSYYILQDCAEFRGLLFWDGDKWTSAENKKVYVDFDEATKAYRKANLACEGKVKIAHVTPGGVVCYQPL